MDPATNQTGLPNFSEPAGGFSAPTAPAFPTQSTPPFVPAPQTSTPPNTGSTNNINNVVASPRESNGKKKKLLATLGILLMLAGIGTGVFLVGNRQLGLSSAWNCSLYTFSLSQDGTVTVANGSSRDEPEQMAEVYINDNLVDTLNVPALAAGEGATLGIVSVPTNQSYSWRIDGTKDCANSGSVTVEDISASCSEVVAYDEDWAALSAAQLSQLSEGDIVRFAVSGTATSGTFERARFSVNGGAAQEVTDKRPGSEDFYYEYIIPAGVTSFNVTAEVFHSELGWF